MSNNRKKYSIRFNAKVALATLKKEQTAAELFQRFGLHPTMIAARKRALLASVAYFF